VGKWQR